MIKEKFTVYTLVNPIAYLLKAGSKHSGLLLDSGWDWNSISSSCNIINIWSYTPQTFLEINKHLHIHVIYYNKSLYRRLNSSLGPECSQVKPQKLEIPVSYTFISASTSHIIEIKYILCRKPFHSLFLSPHVDRLLSTTRLHMMGTRGCSAKAIYVHHILLLENHLVRKAINVLLHSSKYIQNLEIR
jgi:hypothetical protein